MKLSFKSFVLFFSVAFVAISCGGSDNPSPTVNTTCQLTKQTSTSPTSVRVSTYKYGGDGQVVEINNKTTTTGSVATSYEETIAFTYDGSGKLSTRQTTYSYFNGSLVENMTYKANGQLEKMQQSRSGNGTTTENQVLFEYNNTNQVIKTRNTFQDNNMTYTYNNKNLASYSFVLSRETSLFEYKGYDDKKNPLNGLVHAFPDQPNYASPNNYTEIVQTVNGQPNGNNRPFFSHTYNSKNLPTKTEFNNGTQTATLVYEYANCQ